MATPLLSDYYVFQGRPFNNNNWDFNLQKTIDFLTGTYDVTFGNVVANSVIADLTGSTGFPDADVSIEAGENLTAGKLVRQAGGQAFLATTASDAGITNVIGFVTETVSTGETATVRRSGIYEALSGLVVDTTYYVSTLGNITASKPASRAVPVGLALTISSISISLPFSELSPTFPNINCVGTSVFGNLSIATNTITALTGAINLAPASGSAVVLDSAWSFDGNTVTALASGFTFNLDANNTLTVYRPSITDNTTGTVLYLQGKSLGNSMSSSDGVDIKVKLIKSDGTTALDEVAMAFVYNGGTSATKFTGGIDPGANGTFWKIKIIDIGDWNMDSTSPKVVAHGLTLSTIRSVKVSIRQDVNGNLTSLDFADVTAPAASSGAYVADSTSINMYRLVGGYYDNNNFDATSYNRGWITIMYTE